MIHITDTEAPAARHYPLTLCSPAVIQLRRETMPTTGIRRAIADENTPPSLSTKVKPFKNTSRKPRATLLATGNANQAITATQPASKAVAIQVQSPSSDGLDHDIVRTATQDMPPTPPASQSPPPLPRRSRRSNAGVPPTSSQTAVSQRAECRPVSRF